MSNIQPTGNQSLTRNTDLFRQLQEALKVQVKSKPYTACITRQTPSAFIFLIDQSDSMAGDIPDNLGGVTTKAEKLTYAVNKILNDILDRCQKGSEVRDYFELAIIGYGGESPEKANLAWAGKLKGKTWVTISELSESFLYEKVEEVEKNIRGKVVLIPEKMKYWIEPLANSPTTMINAFELAADLLEEWIIKHQNLDVYPPTIIHVTSGELTEAAFETILKTAARLKCLHTMDGNVLLLNLHLSSTDQEPIFFPESKKGLPDNKFAYLLFDISCDLPEVFQNEIAKFKGGDKQGAFTSMVFNGTMDKIIQIMNTFTFTNISKYKF